MRVIAVLRMVQAETQRLSIDLGRRFEKLLQRLLKRAVMIVGLPAVSVGCTAVPEQTAEDLVGQRAISWAEALMELDYNGALSYMTPSYQMSPRADRFVETSAGQAFGDQSLLIRLIAAESGPIAVRCHNHYQYDCATRDGQRNANLL